MRKMAGQKHLQSHRNIAEALEPFVEARKNARLAFLSGAGVSRDPPANCPLAKEMTCSLAEAFWDISIISKRHWQKTTLRRRAVKVRFESLMQVIADTTGTVGFLRVLRGGRPNAIHRMLARALLDGCPVLTTNFDQLIERAVAEKGGSITTLKDARDFKRWRRYSPKGVLAKLHGSLEDLDSLCATIRQVGLLGPAFMWDPPRGNYLSKVRKKYPMVVIGYSGYDDSDILPKLRITASEKPLLWILHSHGRIRLARSQDIKRMATAPGLAEFLEQSGALVLIGNTREACVSIDERTQTFVLVSSVRVASSLPSKLIFHMRRTTAPYLADFLIARMFFEGGYKSASRTLFRLLRSELKGSHPGLSVRCMTNEATVATNLGDWPKAGRLIDEALPALKRYADERSFINACINRALVHRHTGQFAQGKTILKALITQLKGASELQLEYARCLVNLADFLFEEERFDEAMRLLKRARQEFKKVGEHGGIAMAFGVYGKLLFAQGKIEEAMTLLQMALWHYEVAWDESGKARILNNLGTMQRSAGMLDAAVTSFKKARQLGEKLGDPEPVVVSEMGMTTVNLASGKLDSAIRRAKKCLPEAQRLGLSHLVVQTKGNIGLALLDSGRAKKALQIFNELLPLFAANGPAVHLAFTLRNVGECYAKLGVPRKAEEFLSQAKRLYLELGKDQEAKEVKALCLSISRRDRL